jgi:hypothetical protein
VNAVAALVRAPPRAGTASPFSQRPAGDPLRHAISPPRRALLAAITITTTVAGAVAIEHRVRAG